MTKRHTLLMAAATLSCPTIMPCYCGIMFLHQLTLENIRSIPGASFDFTSPENGGVRRWTCLLGENGTGKSTVMRAAALVLAGSDALPELLGEPGRWVRNGKRSGKITARISNQQGELRDLTLELRAGDKLTDVLKRNEAGLCPLDEALSHTMRNYFTVAYGVGRRLPGPGAEKFRSPSQQPRAASMATLFPGDAVLRSVESWAMDLHYRRGTAGLEVVRRAMNSLLPGIKFAGIDKEARALMFQTPDGKVPLAQLSDGFQNVIGWFGDMLFRITEVFQDHRHPLNSRGLLLLDEADLHLHPVWQRKIAEYLQKLLPNFQFLITTHSPLTAQQCGEGELYMLKRDAKNQMRLDHYTGIPNLLRVDQLLVSPVFGLETGMSLEVQTLRADKNRSKEQSERLRQIPRPRVDPASEKEKVALLKEISSALTSRPASPRKSSGAASRSLTAKKTTSARPAGPAKYIRPDAGSVIAAAIKTK